MKKIVSKNLSSSRSEKETNISIRSIDSFNLSKAKIKKISNEIEENEAVKPLRQEIKHLDSLHTLMLQWGYANYLLNKSILDQETEASNQLFDRCKQLIDLKKQSSSLKSENDARSKNKLLDDVLSMEYSSLKSVEEDILISSSYLKELEENSCSVLNRLDLEEGEIISPQVLSELLEKTAYTLKKVSSLVEDESKEIQTLADEMQNLVNVNSEKNAVFDEIAQLEKKICTLTAQEKINAADKAFSSREILLKSFLNEDLI